MASLKLVRSPISRVLFDSWFQAIAPRQENERLRKLILFKVVVGGDHI